MTGKTSIVIALGIALTSGRAALASPCASDVNRDGFTDVTDLIQVILDWGSCEGCTGDVNGDAVVDVSDLVLVITNWGPCLLFEYSETRADPEAEQIALEALGPNGFLQPTDAQYDLVKGDLEAIRAAFPDLAEQWHAPAWRSWELALELDGAAPTDLVDEANGYYQVIGVREAGKNTIILTFPGNLNMPALAEIYEAFDAVIAANLISSPTGENTWHVTGLDQPVRTWEVADGFGDCTEGCTCTRQLTLEVGGPLGVELTASSVIGPASCEF